MCLVVVVQIPSQAHPTMMTGKNRRYAASQHAEKKHQYWFGKVRAKRGHRTASLENSTIDKEQPASLRFCFGSTKPKTKQNTQHREPLHRKCSSDNPRFARSCVWAAALPQVQGIVGPKPRRWCTCCDHLRRRHF